MCTPRPTTTSLTFYSSRSKSLPVDTFRQVKFAMFCLGDRAYGPQFCAAGRKLAVRLLQLNATTCCEIGYGDDGTPDGGVFADCDAWIQEHLLPTVLPTTSETTSQLPGVTNPVPAYRVSQTSQRPDYDPADSSKIEEWEQPKYEQFYSVYFHSLAPRNAYNYIHGVRQTVENNHVRPDSHHKPLPASLLVGTIATNDRITAEGWEQDTRHLRWELSVPPQSQRSPTSNDSLPYRAGDVAVILPANSEDFVLSFLNVLPAKVRDAADVPLLLDYIAANQSAVVWGIGYAHWPKRLTLRGWLTYCADIRALPEREDLRALALCCSLSHSLGVEQRNKLISLSETRQSALYVDYVLREKRTWVDVLYDFDSLRHSESKLSLESLFSLLGPMRPREFSIASSPRNELLQMRSESGAGQLGWGVELCVAVVEGTTRRGRLFQGLCSHYLSRRGLPGHSRVRLWIRPGSFGELPLQLNQAASSSSEPRFEQPILCIGAGTGVAPLRSILQERAATRSTACSLRATDAEARVCSADEASDNVLVFGCRQYNADFYYRSEWSELEQRKCLKLWTAFSRDQERKVYVQEILRTIDVSRNYIARHVIERGGAIYIAGGPKMAAAVKEVILASVREFLGGDNPKAVQLLSRCQSAGLYRVEAWS
jgi:sulfite reductase alpha subunit-like flavoprotein